MSKEKSCFNVLKKYNIYDDDFKTIIKNFKRFALKHHPDRNDNIDIGGVFTSVNGCYEYFLTEKSFINFKKIIYKYENKSKNKSNTKEDITSYDNFVKKPCEGRNNGSWVVEQLKKFCDLLGIEISSKDNKQNICKKIKEYFKNGQVPTDNNLNAKLESDIENYDTLLDKYKYLEGQVLYDESFRQEFNDIKSRIDRVKEHLKRDDEISGLFDDLKV
jgi:hypothetical protein